MRWHSPARRESRSRTPASWHEWDELSLVEERERIAADLHDTVIQRLFATGLGLQGTVRSIDDPGAADRVQEAVDELDETIRQIRSTIFALQNPRVAGGSLRYEILALATEAAAGLGFEPAVRFEGLIDHRVGDRSVSSSSPFCARPCRTWFVTPVRPGWPSPSK